MDFNQRQDSVMDGLIERTAFLEDLLNDRQRSDSVHNAGHNGPKGASPVHEDVAEDSQTMPLRRLW